MKTIFSVCLLWYYSSLVNWWFCNMVNLVVVSSYYFLRLNRFCLISLILLLISMLKINYSLWSCQLLELFPFIYQQLLLFDWQFIIIAALQDLQFISAAPHALPCRVYNLLTCFHIWQLRNYNFSLALKNLLFYLLFRHLSSIICTHIFFH